MSVDDVAESTRFELLLANRVAENPPPTVEELRILREEVDAEPLHI